MNRGHTFAPGAIDGPYRSPRSVWLRTLARRAVCLAVGAFVLGTLAGVLTGGAL